MKRSRFIVLFAVFPLFSFTSSLAQNRFYLACNFYALNGTCFNQPPSWYAQTETDGYSPEQIEHFTNQFITDYPNYPVVAPASNLYNCHGFAYSVFQGGEIPENAVQPGDIATIIDPDDNGTYSIHSSIVLNQDTLISKLGNYPVFKHHKYDPYPLHGSYLQGYLELKNGATIENAVCAADQNGRTNSGKVLLNN